MTLRFSDAGATPVYSKTSADEIGTVIRWIVDAADGRIRALHVTGRRRKAQVVDWADVVGFGPDAVVVSDEQRLREPQDDYERRITAGKLELQGRRVLTDRGYEIGALVDVEFDEGTGGVATAHTDRAAVRGDGMIVIGDYAMVVAHDAVTVHGADDQ